MNYIVPFAELKNRIKVVSSKGQLKVDLNYDELLGIIQQLLYAVTVDEKWYCETYPDVGEAIEAKTHKTASHHFVENGYAEGRRPFYMEVDEDWYLDQNPDVRDRINTGEFASAQDHFSKHGYDEGRRPAPP
jgi:hypothetical protein